MTEAKNKRILVVEDDPSIALGLQLNLRAEGYEVVLAETGTEGLKRAAAPWDLVILDVMLPQLNGFEVLKRLREQGNQTPILMLSAKGMEGDKVRGLELGAEDYVTKPFGLKELLARIRVILRRAEALERPAEPPTEIRLGAYAVDAKTRTVRRDGEPIEMTATEFDILWALGRANGDVLSRQEILRAVWGADHHGTERTVDNFVAQLRSKLEANPSRPTLLLTVRGVGYRVALDA